MPNIVDLADRLSIVHQEALLELASRGSGGSFDQQALSELFSMGLVEVRSGRVAMTEAGRAALAELTHSHSSIFARS
jgi:superfamily II helicase